MALFVSVFLCACAGAFAFNVDIPSRTIYKGPSSSMFGFTVQCHIDGSKKMILVGAPEDDPHFTRGVTKPGAVYRCHSERYRPSGTCDVMDFDKRRENNVDTLLRQIDNKSNQWFGATLMSTGKNGPIVACAPRYVSYVTAKLNQRDPVGSCFVATSSDASDVKEFSPCRTWFRSMDEASHGQRKTGVCQAGFSAAVSKNGNRLFMGAPGSFYWQGQVLSVGDNPSIMMTPEGSPIYDDSYMGYSLTVGKFSGVQGIAVGVPRGSDLKGLVVIYTWDLKNIKNITGSQIGAYFGYSMTSGDIDGDGTDDLIIGSPMFTRPKTDGFEHGRIYVIYQGRDANSIFTRNHARTGEISQGRFGLAVTSLGDINFDGFGDIAVGAPYGGAHGRGVVYIYHGSARGIREKYSQAITAEEISPSLSTFGFSLSGGVDLDDNSYPDLAVGAYKSDSVVFLKARPVVNVTARVIFLTDSGSSRTISMSNKNCRLSNGTQAVCRNLQFCLSYSGINVDQQIEFIVNLDLDSKQKPTSKRLFLYERRDTTYTTRLQLYQDQPVCKTINVYLDEEIQDKLTPIDVKITYDLVNLPSGGGIVPPVLNPTIEPETDSLSIQKNCGPDDICIPDLRMVVPPPLENYIIGSNKNIKLDVKIENAGEDAFEAAYYLQLPAGVTYAKMERLDGNAAKTPIYCSTRNKGLNTTLKCDLGNPMESGQKVEFQIVLEADSRVTSLVFDMETNSTNPEAGTEYDNTLHMAIGIVFLSDFTIVGISEPPELHYNASLYAAGAAKDDTKLGPQVIHKYNIKNDGPLDVEAADLFLIWPYKTLDSEENLMYMLESPQVAGNIQCESPRSINPENLEISIPYYDLLVKERAALVSSGMYSESEIRQSGGGYKIEQFYQSKRNTWGQLSADERGIIMSNLAAIYASSGAQGHSTYGRGTEEESRHYWESLTERERQEISRNLASALHRETSEGFTADEEENIRRVLISALTRNQGGYNQGGYLNGGLITRFNKTNYNTAAQSERKNTWGQLSMDERNIFMSNLGAIYGSSGAQGHTTYGRGTEEESRYYWESLTERERQEISRNLASALQKETTGGFTADEEESIRRVLISALTRTQGGYNQGGNVNGGLITRFKNKTVVYDQNHNIVSQSESSTEYYGGIGHEGEAGSSFNKYSQSRFNQDSSQQGAVQSVNLNRGSGIQSQGSGSQNRQSSAGQGFVHGNWATTETVNSEVMNAGSATFRNGVTVVGDDEDEIGGFGANAARGTGEFRYGVADVTNAGSGSRQGSGGAGGYQTAGGQYQGGYRAAESGGFQGGAASGGSYQSGAANGGSYRTGGGYSYSSSSSSHSGGQTQYGSHSGEFAQRQNTRRRRQIDLKNDPQLSEILNKCQEKYQCQTLHCYVGPLMKGQEVWLALRARINASVLNDITASNYQLRLSTMTVARASKLSGGITPTNPLWRSSEAQTLVTPQLEAIDSGIPLWVVVLAAVIGALLLLLLIFALYKCGFFKRNRPSDHAERQPLNGRDEHL